MPGLHHPVSSRSPTAVAEEASRPVAAGLACSKSGRARGLPLRPHPLATAQVELKVLPVGGWEGLRAGFLQRAREVAQAAHRFPARAVQQAHRLAHASRQNRPAHRFQCPVGRRGLQLLVLARDRSGGPHAPAGVLTQPSSDWCRTGEVLHRGPTARSPFENREKCRTFQVSKVNAADFSAQLAMTAS